MRGSRVGFTIVVLAILGFSWFVFGMPGWPRSYSDTDVESVEKSIRDEWAKRDGVKVNEVVLVKRSPTELTGYAKLSIGSIPVMKDCSATMDSGSGNSIWKCQ